MSLSQARRRLDGGVPLRPFRPADLLSLRAVLDAAVAPAGDEFAYALAAPDGQSELWRGDGDLGEPKPLTRGPHDVAPRYSPDGTEIAFLRGPQGAAQIFLLDRRGGEAMPFTRLRHGVEQYAWSPDGRAIAAIAPCGPEGPLPLANGDEGRPAPSTALRALLVLQLDGTWREISPGGVDCSHPVFSPDGRQVAFLARQPHESTPCLATAPSDGGAVRCLVPSSFAPGPAAYAPDGSALAFAAMPPGPLVPGVYTVPAGGGEPTPYSADALDFLPAQDQAPAFEPGGTWLYVLAREEGAGRLAEVRPQGDWRMRLLAEGSTVRFALDEACSLAALVVEGPGEPAHFELRDLSGRLRLRSRHEDPALAGVRRTTPQRLRIAGGAPAWAYLPPGRVRATAVLLASDAPCGFCAQAQAICAAGLAVIAAPAGALPDAYRAALAQHPGLDPQRFGVVAEGRDAWSALPLLWDTRALAAVFTSVPKAPDSAASARTHPGTGPAVLLLAGADAPTGPDVLPEGLAHAALELRVFPEERGPVRDWRSAAQSARLALELDWLVRYLAQ